MVKQMRARSSELCLTMEEQVQLLALIAVATELGAVIIKKVTPDNVQDFAEECKLCMATHTASKDLGNLIEKMKYNAEIEQETIQ